MVAPFCCSLPPSFASQNPPPSSEGGSTQTSFFIVHRLTSFEPRDYRVVFGIQKAEFTLSPFITQEGRTLVPAREICGYLNKNIIWLDSPARISVSSGSDILVCAIGESNYSINGNLYETDAAAQLIDGHAYIPLRTLAEFLGYSISFIPSSNL